MKTMTKKILALMLAIFLLSTITIFAIPTAGAVSANLIDSTKSGSLSIYKYEMPDVSEATVRGNGEATNDIPDTATALPGVKFKITRVADFVTNSVINKTYYTPAGLKLPTAEEAAKMTSIATYTAVTGSDGLAKFNDLPLGIYLVQETEAPSQVTGPVADYVVSVPMTNSTGTAWNYDVYTYPKNETVYSDITIKKTDLKSGAVQAGAEFDLYTSTNNSTWELVERGLVTGADGTVTPTNSLATSCYYKLVETKAPAGGYVLDTDKATIVWIDADANVCDPETHNVLDSGNPYLIEITNDKPTIEKLVGTTATDVNYENAVIQTVKDKVYYKVNITIPIVEDMSSYQTLKVSDTLHNALTLNGTPVLSDNSKTYAAGTDYTYSMDSSTNTFTIDIKGENLVVSGDYISLTLDYNCSVDKDLVKALGTEIINTANLKYSTVVGNNPTPTPDVPEDITSNETEVHTSGFEFKKTNPENAALVGAKFKLFATKADALARTNALSFMDKNGNEITEAVSGSDGLVSFFGLGYGDNGDDVTTGTTKYYVVETFAPNGYNLLAEPVEIEVSQNTHSYDVTQMNVVNNIKTELPLTGGTGTLIFYAVGAVAAITGGTSFVVTRKRKNKAVK